MPTTVERIFGISQPLTQRDATANTFDTNLTLPVARRRNSVVQFPAEIGAPLATTLAKRPTLDEVANLEPPTHAEYERSLVELARRLKRMRQAL